MDYITSLVALYGRITFWPENVLDNTVSSRISEIQKCNNPNKNAFQQTISLSRSRPLSLSQNHWNILASVSMYTFIYLSELGFLTGFEMYEMKHEYNKMNEVHKHT